MEDGCLRQRTPLRQRRPLQPSCALSRTVCASTLRQPFSHFLRCPPLDQPFLPSISSSSARTTTTVSSLLSGSLRKTTDRRGPYAKVGNYGSFLWLLPTEAPDRGPAWYRPGEIAYLDAIAASAAVSNNPRSELAGFRGEKGREIDDREEASPLRESESSTGSCREISGRGLRTTITPKGVFVDN
jgi:hypothetical protein